MCKFSVRFLIGALSLSLLPGLFTLGQPDLASRKAGRQALVSDGGNIIAYTEGDGFKAIPGELIDDGTPVDSVTVRIINGYNPEQDALWLFASDAGINVFSDGRSIVMTGNGTVAQYNALLANIYFSNYSDDPTDDDRILRGTAYFPDGRTAQLELTLEVIPVNDPPVVNIYSSGGEVFKAGTIDGGPFTVEISDPDNSLGELEIEAQSNNPLFDVSFIGTETPGYYLLSVSVNENARGEQAVVTVTARDRGDDGQRGNQDDLSGSESITIFEGTVEHSGTFLIIRDAFTSPGDEGPVKLDIDLVNTSQDSVAGLQFDIILSYVLRASYGKTAEDILNTEENDLPEGFEVLANLIGTDTLRIVVYGTGETLLPPGGYPITLGQLCFTPAAEAGDPDFVLFDAGSVRVSDPDGFLLNFYPGGAQIATVIPLDVTQDGDIDIRDVVVLVAEIVGRAGHVLPTEVNSRAFQIRDVDNNNRLNVTDAVGIVRHILGLPPVSQKQIAGTPAQVSLGALVALPDGQLAVPVLVNAVGVAGIQATFTFDPAKVTLGAPVAQSASQNLLIDSQIKGSELKIVVLSLGAEGLVTAGQPAFLIPVTLKDESAVLNLTEITLADRGANTLIVQPGVISQPLGKQGSVPKAFALNSNRPNPFNPSTEIAYEVPQQAHITLVVYNVLGQEVIRLVDEVQQAGRYTVTWNARNATGQAVSSGVYLYRMISSTGYTDTKRMTLLK